tara:strand:+ start:77 stop:589 length:513 start_codon:yes stop_codon:yes gene_type:complete
MNHRALFLDRDGVINFDYGYVHKIVDFDFRPEIFEICKIALLRKYKIIIITNQAGIGRKIFSEKDFFLLNEHMIREFEKKLITISGIYYCPYHPTEGKGKYLKDSFFRKPNPGMILKASKDYDINLKESLMIGDKESDYEAARRAKLKYYIDAKNSKWKLNTLNFLHFEK